MSAILRAPFPYFGGKREAAALVWSALGRVQNYVEPFFGSGAVLLARPRETWATADGPGTETVNDRSRFLANFWRALRADPDAVAAACDWPVNETDLHARHRWLVAQLPALAAAMDADPEHYDAKVAGWWCWGACGWIGSGWCDEERAALRQCGTGSAPDPDSPASLPVQLPHLGNAGQGLHRKLPHLGDAGRGLHRELPHLGDAGRGTDTLSQQLPHLSGNHDSGRGLHSLSLRPRIGEYLHSLAARLRGTRVACGDWSRVCGDSVTWRHGMTGVFLDPPYAEGNQQYAAGGTGTGLSAEVRAWAIDAGKRPDMRVILAGLDGEHDMPTTWRVVPWKARGGYGSQGATANENRHRETLWLSPACIDPTRQRGLFDGAAR